MHSFWKVRARLGRAAFVAFATLFCTFASLAPTQAAPLGRATAAFDNARPGKAETAWGRLVADALRVRAQSDVAIVDAGSLNAGTLAQGDIERGDVERLLAFGTRDGGVTLRVTGAQLKAAIARAVQDYPTRSPSFLHASGLNARFADGRVTQLQVNGRDVADADALVLAMPQSVAQGAIFGSLWKGAAQTPLAGTLSDIVCDYVRAQGTVSPQAQGRIAPG